MWLSVVGWWVGPSTTLLILAPSHRPERLGLRHKHRIHSTPNQHQHHVRPTHHITDNTPPHSRTTSHPHTPRHLSSPHHNHRPQSCRKRTRRATKLNQPRYMLRNGKAADISLYIYISYISNILISLTALFYLPSLPEISLLRTHLDPP